MFPLDDDIDETVGTEEDVSNTRITVTSTITSVSSSSSTLSTSFRRKFVPEMTAPEDVRDQYTEEIGGKIADIMKALSETETVSKELTLKIEPFVLVGVHPSYRPLLWQILSGGKRRQRQWPDHYGQLVEKAEKVYCDTRSSKHASDIEQDLVRTFPGHKYFESQGGVDALRRVLRAYAIRNEEVGYCQSMNSIAAVLLLHLEEEKAFWIIVGIVENILDSYYTKDMKGFLADQRLLEKCVQEFLPEVATALARLDFDLASISTNWFLCLFIGTLPWQCVYHVMDTVFLFGPEAIIRVSLEILFRKKDQLAHATETCQIFEILKPQESFVLDDAECSTLIVDAFQRFGVAGALDGRRRRLKDEHELRWADWLQSHQRLGGILPEGNSEHARRFRSLVKKGIPFNLRPMMWQIATNAAVDQKQREGHYHRLVDEAEGLSKYVDAIDADVRRTKTPQGSTLPIERQNALRRVLLAFSVHNPEVGYCQSMNNIAAVIMQFTAEESTFWLLSRIVDDVLPGYYTMSMDGLNVDQLVLFECVKRYLPQLTAKFAELGFNIKMVTTKWFLCMFIGCLPWKATYRVIDAVLCLGADVLLRVALAVFRIKEREILKCNTIEEVYVILQPRHGPIVIEDADILMGVAFTSLSAFNDVDRIRKVLLERRRRVVAQALDERANYESDVVMNTAEAMRLQKTLRDRTRAMTTMVGAASAALIHRSLIAL